MQNYKNITPLIYAIFALPVIFGTFYISDFAQRTLGLYLDIFNYIGIKTVFLVYGSLIFLTANYLIIRLEKPNEKFIITHFRQSAVYYVVFIIFIIGLIKYGEIGSRGTEILSIIFPVSIMAIFINAVSVLIFTKLYHKNT